MPALSVLIPTYQRAAKLARCLQSVTACSLPDLEILVADNASPDETPDVLRACRDPRLRCWRQETNIGPERNMFDLLEQARGTWLMYLTDDDFLLPGALERLLEILRAHEDAGVFLSPLKQSRDDGRDLPDYQFCPRGGYFAAGLEALLLFVPAVHILSRITLRRDLIDFDGARRQIGTLYFQMHAVGAILKQHPGFYIEECFVEHTVGNEVFWKYTPDFMVGARLGLFEDLLPGSTWRKERHALMNQLLDGVYRSHFPKTWAAGEWLRHQRALLRAPQVRRSLRYWWHVGRFLAVDARRVKKKKPKKKKRP